MDLKIDRKPNEIFLQGQVSTVIETPCSRCAESITLPLAAPVFLTVTLSKKRLPEPRLDDEKDILFLSQDHPVYALGGLAVELLSLSIPLQPLCKSECQGLCDQCGKNLNEGRCQCTKPLDERWAPLLVLNDKLKKKTKH